MKNTILIDQNDIIKSFENDDLYFIKSHPSCEGCYFNNEKREISKCTKVSYNYCRKEGVDYIYVKEKPVRQVKKKLIFIKND